MSATWDEEAEKSCGSAPAGMRVVEAPPAQAAIWEVTLPSGVVVTTREISPGPALLPVLSAPSVLSVEQADRVRAAAAERAMAVVARMAEPPGMLLKT